LKNAIDVFLINLKKLERQLIIARLSDFSFLDAREALDILQGRLQKKRDQVADCGSFSEGTRNAVLRDVNHLIFSVHHNCGNNYAQAYATLSSFTPRSWKLVNALSVPMRG